MASKKKKKKAIKPKKAPKAKAKKPSFLLGLLLKPINLLQKLTIRYSRLTGLYYSLTQLAFRLETGKNLVDQMVANSKEYRSAAKKHAELVVETLYADSTSKNKTAYKKRARETFKAELTSFISL